MPQRSKSWYFSLQIYHSSVNTSGGNFLQHQWFIAMLLVKWIIVNMLLVSQIRGGRCSSVASEESIAKQGTHVCNIVMSIVSKSTALCSNWSSALSIQTFPVHIWWGREPSWRACAKSLSPACRRLAVAMRAAATGARREGGGLTFSSSVCVCPPSALSVDRGLGWRVRWEAAVLGGASPCLPAS